MALNVTKTKSMVIATKPKLTSLQGQGVEITHNETTIKTVDSHRRFSLPRSRSLSRHATLLPTNGCSHSNNIPFPLFLRSNEGANHVSAN